MEAFRLLVKTIASMRFILMVRLTTMCLALPRQEPMADRPILIRYQLMPLINSRLFFRLLMPGSVASQAVVSMLLPAQEQIQYRDQHGIIFVMNKWREKHLAMFLKSKGPSLAI